jgi:3-isopropylmalate/(R)-2-methylmalate dehydratase small subunit
LSENILQALSEQIGEDSETNELCINLRDCSLTAANGDRYIFEIEPLNREMLMGGLDIIDMTLSYEDKIISYEIKDRETRPWVYLS